MEKDLIGSLKKKTKDYLKAKRLSVNFGGLGRLSTIYLSLKDLKKSMQATWSNTDSGVSDSTTSKDARYEHNDFLALIASVNFEHETDNEFMLVFLRILLLNIKI